MENSSQSKTICFDNEYQTKGPLPVTFVIPAKNEEHEIADTLSTIHSYCSNLCYEIIVVDNASTDKTAKISSSMGAKVIEMPNGTVGELRNHGVTSASSPIIIFLDADVSLTSDWSMEINESLELMKNNPNLITGSHCVPPENGSFLDRYWFGSFSQSEETTHIGTGHLIITKSFFNEIGGFTPGLRTGEDYDLCSKAKCLGGSVLNNSKLKVIHRDYPKDIKSFVLREAWHGDGDTQGFNKLFTSKVSIASLIFISSHALLFSGLFFPNVGAALSTVGASIIAALLLSSSIFKFYNCNFKVILANCFIFYFYYLGRSLSIIKTLVRYLVPSKN